MCSQFFTWQVVSAVEGCSPFTTCQESGTRPACSMSFMASTICMQFDGCNLQMLQSVTGLHQSAYYNPLYTHVYIILYLQIVISYIMEFTLFISGIT